MCARARAIGVISIAKTETHFFSRRFVVGRRADNLLDPDQAEVPCILGGGRENKKTRFARNKCMWPTWRAGRPFVTASGTSPSLFSRSTSFVRHGGNPFTASGPRNRFPPAEMSVRAERALRSGRTCSARQGVKVKVMGESELASRCSSKTSLCLLF